MVVGDNHLHAVVALSTASKWLNGMGAELLKNYSCSNHKCESNESLFLSGAHTGTLIQF